MEYDRISRNEWLTTSLAVGALIAGAYLAYRIVSRIAAKTDQKHVEKIRDKTLKDSFPASDPPASQFFDIPVNRH